MGNLFDNLIRPVREADASDGGNHLRRYLQGPQSISDLFQYLVRGTEARGVVVPDLIDFAEPPEFGLWPTPASLPPGLIREIDPARCRSDLLQYLKDHVGFTRELDSITSRLSIADLRRLIAVAVALWKQRHTERGLLNVIRFLTGRDAVFTNWFGFRWLLGETLLGEEQLVAGGDSWIIGGDVSVYDEFFSNLRVMDDGTLDELLLIDLVRLMRPMSERIEVFLLDFLDTFDLDLSRWTVVTGAPPTIVDGEMVIPNGGTEEAVVPIFTGTPSAQTNYILITLFRTIGVANRFFARWYIEDPGQDYFEFTVDPNQSGGGSVLTLQRFVGGVATHTIGLNPVAFSIIDGANYKLRLETINLVGPLVQVKVYIDNNLAFDETFPSGPPGFGNFQFGAFGTGAGAVVDNVESWRSPARFATVGINDAVVQTANFVQ